MGNEIEDLKQALREAILDVETLLRDEESGMGEGLRLQYKLRLIRYRKQAGPPPREKVVERPCMGEIKSNE